MKSNVTPMNPPPDLRHLLLVTCNNHGSQRYHIKGNTKNEGVIILAIIVYVSVNASCSII